MTHRRLLAAAITIGLVGLLGPAQAQDGVLLRFQPPAGLKVTYDAAFSGSGQVQVVGQNQAVPITLAGSTRMSERIVSASTDGTRLVEAEVISSNVTNNGTAVPMNMVGRKMRFQSDALGRVWGFEGDPLNSGGGTGSPINFDAMRMVNDLGPAVRFPRAAVRVGQTWVDEFDLQTPGGGTQRVSVRSVLANYGVMGGRPVATVDTQLRLPLNMEEGGIRLAGTMTANVRSYYFADTGMVGSSAWRAAIGLSAKVVGQNGQESVLGTAAIPDLRVTMTQVGG